MNGNTIFTYFSFTTKTITDWGNCTSYWGYFKPFFFDKLGNSRISEVIKGKQYHWLYICLFKIIFWKFILNSNLNGDSCWIKVHNLFYLFILSYGHLDLLTSMYSYQDATKFHGSGHLQIILHLKKITECLKMTTFKIVFTFWCFF